MMERCFECGKPCPKDVWPESYMFCEKHMPRKLKKETE